MRVIACNVTKRQDYYSPPLPYTGFNIIVCRNRLFSYHIVRHFAKQDVSFLTVRSVSWWFKRNDKATTSARID